MGFAWAGVKQYMDEKREDRLISEERQQKRKDMIFQTMLPQLIKRRTQMGSMEKEAKEDLLWVKSRLGDTEDSNRVLSVLSTDPKKASELRKVITGAEKNTGRRFEGQTLLDSFDIIGPNLDDPDFVEKYTQTGDAYDAILLEIEQGEDVSLEDIRTATMSIPSRPEFAVDVDPNIYKEGLSLEDAKKQAEVFETAITRLAQQDVERLSEELSVGDFNKYMEDLENYGKDSSATNRINTMYFDRANEMLADSGYPTLENIDENPYIGLMEPAESTDQQQNEVLFSGPVTPEVAADIPTLEPYVGQNVIIRSDRTVEVQ